MPPQKQQLLLRVYQYSICPFCNRAKAFLKYSRTPFQAVEVNPLTKSQIRQWKPEYSKVPIATIDVADGSTDEEGGRSSQEQRRTFFGSDKIIDGLLSLDDDGGGGGNDLLSVRRRLEARWRQRDDENGDCSSNPMTMDYFRNSPSSIRWSEFALEELAPLLYPNMCRTLGDSFRAFGYVNSVGSFGAVDRMLIRGLGSVAMYVAASKVKRTYCTECSRSKFQQSLCCNICILLGEYRVLAHSPTHSRIPLPYCDDDRKAWHYGRKGGNKRRPDGPRKGRPIEQ